MARNTTGTMTELLRAALLEAPSLNAIEKATGVRRQTLASFMRGEQVSIHLASADALAEYFGISCVNTSRPKLRSRIFGRRGERMIDCREAASLYGCTMRYLRRLARDGRIKASEVAGSYLFKESEVRALANQAAKAIGRKRKRTGGFKPG